MKAAVTFLDRRLWQPLLGQLRQGTSPDKIALSVALGAVLSTFPILGTTTLLCFLAGVAFRLNPVAIQSVNYLMTPVQLAGIPLFIRIGEEIFGLSPIDFHPGRLAQEFGADPGLFFRTYGQSALAGIAVWAALAGPAIWTVHRLFLPLLRRKAKET